MLCGRISKTEARLAAGAIGMTYKYLNRRGKILWVNSYFQCVNTGTGGCRNSDIVQVEIATAVDGGCDRRDNMVVELNYSSMGSSGLDGCIVISDDIEAYPWIDKQIGDQNGSRVGRARDLELEWSTTTVYQSIDAKRKKSKDEKKHCCLFR